MSFIILQQTLTMLFLMAVGLVLAKIGMIDNEMSRRLGKLLVSCIIPCVAVRSFMVPMMDNGLTMLGFSALAGLVSLAISMGISYILFARRQCELDFASAFSNAGFVGIPLVTATIGEHAAFYIAPMISFLNIFQWTYGEWLLIGDRSKVQLKTVLLNPVLIATVIGIVIYGGQIPIPGIVENSIEMLVDTNTPLAMLVLGSYLAKVAPRDLVQDKRVWAGSLTRLVLVPCAMAVIIRICGLASNEIIVAIFIASSAPVGANVAIFAQQCSANYNLSVGLVCLSTLLSVITMPLVFQLLSFGI